MDMSNGVGLVSVVTPSQVTKQIEESGKPITADQQVIDSLASYVKTCWEKARNNKITSGLTERLLNCDRARRGEYEPAKLSEIRKIGGSEIYMMLTDIKCRAALSWIKDVMQTYGSETWTLEPNAEPALPDDLREAVIEGVAEEARQAFEQGVTQPDPAAFRDRIEQMTEEVRHKLREAAEKTTESMRLHILSQFQTGKWNKAFDEFLNDFVTYPAGFIKGPVVRRRRQMRWTKDFKPEVTVEARREFYRISPYDIFFSPENTSMQDGYVCERVRYSVTELQSMKGVRGYRDDQIDETILNWRAGALKEWLYGDVEKARLDGKGQMAALNPSENVDGIEFWGQATGKVLADWGMKGVKENETYEITAILVGRNVIRATLNPDPLGVRPYYSASFDPIPGSILGTCPPELMADIQAMCNSAARALANNMAIASGPLVEVTIDRLPDGERLTNVYPWKLYQTTSDKTGGGQPAVRFYQPDMHAQELLEIFRFYSTRADEVTGIPNYVYGSGQAGGAGRTAHGLAMLMDNASKGIKGAISNIDQVVEAVVTFMYVHNMLFDSDETIKGDMKIVARGALGMVMREQLQEKRQAYLQATLNPIDAQIMGMDGRAYLLEKTAAPLQLDVRRLVPSAEVLKQRMKEAQQAMVQAQQQEQVPAGVDIQRDDSGAVQGMNFRQ